jgi:hypothetical protein
MKKKAEEEYWQKVRDEGNKAQKNQSLVAYDILTLQYANNTDGEQQKYCDDVVRFKAAMRSASLVEKGDTRVGYNIISGGERPPIRYPQPIQKPTSLMNGGQMSARVDQRNH